MVSGRARWLRPWFSALQMAFLRGCLSGATMCGCVSRLVRRFSQRFGGWSAWPRFLRLRGARLPCMRRGRRRRRGPLLACASSGCTTCTRSCRGRSPWRRRPPQWSVRAGLRFWTFGGAWRTLWAVWLGCVVSGGGGGVRGRSLRSIPSLPAPRWGTLSGCAGPSSLRVGGVCCGGAGFWEGLWWVASRRLNVSCGCAGLCACVPWGWLGVWTPSVWLDVPFLGFPLRPWWGAWCRLVSVLPAWRA